MPAMRAAPPVAAIGAILPPVTGSDGTDDPAVPPSLLGRSPRSVAPPPGCCGVRPPPGALLDGRGLTRVGSGAGGESGGGVLGSGSGGAVVGSGGGVVGSGSGGGSVGSGVLLAAGFDAEGSVSTADRCGFGLSGLAVAVAELEGLTSALAGDAENAPIVARANAEAANAARRCRT